MFSPNPNPSAPVPAIEPTMANNADRVNEQIQPILDRLQFLYNKIPVLAAKQTELQNRFTGVGDVQALLNQLAAGNASLGGSNDALESRINSLLAAFNALDAKVSSLTGSANSIESNANGKRVGVNVQSKDADLTDLAGLVASTNSAIAIDGSGNLINAVLPNLGILPPAVYQGAWSVASGGNSGVTAGVANTWVAVPIAQVYADGGYSTSAGRVSVAAGTYQIFAQVCGVGCVEIASQCLLWVGGSSSVVAEGTIGRTAISGGNIGQSWTVKSYIKDTVSLNAGAIELRLRFKQAHSTAALSAGMPISIAGLNEDFASLTLTKIG